MEEPKSLDSLFKEKIFRIPDFQRGYAWGKSQWKSFWEDLVNLPNGRSHYVGVLTLKEMPAQIDRKENEYWLIEDHSYKMYSVVDGQQRLTTFIIFLQSFIDFVRQLPENKDLANDKIYLSENLNLSDVVDKYLFRTKPTGDRFRTYKFGYAVDNPSYQYLRYRIFDEPGPGLVDETFYTLNLRNARAYFYGQFVALYEAFGLDGLEEVYKKLTKRFLFNEYIIKDEFDVFVAFETMNNRGKKLSDLELLKNRLIYLTTLYDDKEMDLSDRKSLRDGINNAWKEVYYQLGRNDKHPLNDDEFLRAHWIMYYKYSRETGRDYIRFLLDEKFTPQNVHKSVEKEIPLDVPEEHRTDFEYETDNENGDPLDVASRGPVTRLPPSEIKDYALSLKESVVHWFNSYYPHLSKGLSDEERQALDRLNRIGMGYFRPLVMAILKNETDEAKRIHIFDEIERFIFLAFRLGNAKSNYRSSEFYIAAREFEKGDSDTTQIEEQLSWRLGYLFNPDGTFRSDEFYNLLLKKFQAEVGFYGWYGLRYFLYEYELSLFAQSRQKKVDWEDLLRTPADKISIEHIYPQTKTKYWSQAFAEVPHKYQHNYQSSLGNLLLLSMSINSSLQNETFEEKKQPKFNSANQKVRNGYGDGSHSEIEVSRFESWGPNEIKERGLSLLAFMADRWNLKFKDNKDMEDLLFLAFE